MLKFTNVIFIKTVTKLFEFNYLSQTFIISLVFNETCIADFLNIVNF